MLLPGTRRVVRVLLTLAAIALVLNTVAPSALDPVRHVLYVIRVAGV